jgi:hypothetical protein
MKQHDDYETSTRVCACGASFTWSSYDPELEKWMTKHRPHDEEKLTQVTTEDGERAGKPR